MIAAPLVMPDVITGLSLLLLFVSLQELTGWPGSRGANTITIAHITFSMAYVAVIVQARLANMDQSLEEAAMDLGGRPFAVTRDITLPLIAPAMASGWLLAFTLSLDDLVIASFTSGAGASTLPMVIFSKVRLGRDAGDQRPDHAGDRGSHGGRGDRRLDHGAPAARVDVTALNPAPLQPRPVCKTRGLIPAVFRASKTLQLIARQCEDLSRQHIDAVPHLSRQRLVRSIPCVIRAFIPLSRQFC